MSLLEIDKRVEFILRAQKEKQRYFLKDLSAIIFYGVANGNATVKSRKKNYEKQFHETIDKLLQTNPQEDKITNDPEAELRKIFG